MKKLDYEKLHADVMARYPVVMERLRSAEDILYDRRAANVADLRRRGFIVPDATRANATR